MRVNLGINTGFALNRFPTPEEWIPLVRQEFCLRIVQFTADLLNPSLGHTIVNHNIKRINKLCAQYDVIIKHTFTGAFTRVNHLAHPDLELRRYWKNWFFKFVDISVDLGAEDMGSHLGIFSVFENKDKVIKKKRFIDVINAWHEIAEYAYKKGLKYLTWEPMSISREMGETIKEARKIQNRLNKNSCLDIFLCLDVDHGDVSSIDPDDTDPYVWLKKFASKAPILHIKQTFENKGGHWPFVSEYNKKGKIRPEALFTVLKDSRVSEIDLILELSFKEREPFESKVVCDIKKSVAYWQPFVSI